jgi:hypothetical protein
MLNISGLSLACAIALMCATIVCAGEQKGSWFYPDYAVVFERLKAGQGRINELVALAKDDPDHTLAQFWWYRAVRYCEASTMAALELLLEQHKHKPRTHAELLNIAREQTAPCRYSYYVDHWDEINTMILQQYQVLQKSRGR